MKKTVVETEFVVRYHHSGFPSQRSGPFKTLEAAEASIESYTGPEHMKGGASITKFVTTAESIPRPGKVFAVCAGGSGYVDA